jgi:hypothetical protein
MKKTVHMEVGSYQDKVGYTAYFDDGSKEHHLFSIEVAMQLAEKLMQAVIERCREQAARSPQNYPSDQVQLDDSANIGLVKGEEDADKEKIH